MGTSSAHTPDGGPAHASPNPTPGRPLHTAASSGGLRKRGRLGVGTRGSPASVPLHGCGSPPAARALLHLPMPHLEREAAGASSPPSSPQPAAQPISPCSSREHHCVLGPPLNSTHVPLTSSRPPAHPAPALRPRSWGVAHPASSAPPTPPARAAGLRLQLTFPLHLDPGGTHPFCGVRRRHLNLRSALQQGWEEDKASKGPRPTPNEPHPSCPPGGRRTSRVSLRKPGASPASAAPHSVSLGLINDLEATANTRSSRQGHTCSCCPTAPSASLTSATHFRLRRGSRGSRDLGSGLPTTQNSEE